jgi:hypothetical protein
VEVAFAAWERAARLHFWRHLGRRLTRHSQGVSILPLPEIRIANCASSVGSDVLLESTQRDSRHEGRGGSAWELPPPASVRQSVTRALLPRESTLRPTPSTEPGLFLRAELPLEARLSTLATLTLCALLPLREPSPRNPPTSDTPCRLQAPPTESIR